MLPAGIGYMAGCRLVTMLVGSRGRVGLVTPTPNGHLPALFGGPFHVQLGEWGFVRWAVAIELPSCPSLLTSCALRRAISRQPFVDLLDRNLALHLRLLIDCTFVY